jgi:tetratricopeptide (TPR) repeat protein
MAEENREDNQPVILQEGDDILEKKGDEDKKQESSGKFNVSISIPKIELPKIDVADFYEQNKKKFAVVGVSIISLIVVAVLLLLFFKNISKENAEWENEKQSRLEKEQAMLEQKFLNRRPKDSQVEEMIKRANLLYQQGNRDDALKLYNRIATYNASLSYYNLGVARLKQGHLKEAINAFDKAIINKEHICVSAINAAVCSKQLNEPHKMKAYLDLAYKYLPEELDSPLYSYYYSLISYYRGNYYETFSSLQHRTSPFFEDQKNLMESRLYLHFENYGKSITALENSLEDEDRGSLGLLYANMGELQLAKRNLITAIEENREPLRDNSLALSYVDMKLGNIRQAGINIGGLNERYEDNMSGTHEIDITLKESMFDVQKAQQTFKEEMEFDKNVNYQTIFYFAPYKIFDAKSSVSLIRKGSSTIYFNEVDEATKYLRKGAKYSDVNKYILLAVKEAFNKRLRTANSILKDVSESHPKHAILQYNIALTYAQLGDMVSANRHFIRSYHLNSRDYLSGIFALMTAQLIGKDLSKMEEVILENLSLEDDSRDINFYKALINFRNNNYPAIRKWVEYLTEEDEKEPFYMGLAYLGTILTNEPEKNRRYSEILMKQLPNDILIHLLYMYSQFKDMDIKNFSKSVIYHFRDHPMPLYDFYYGARITQEMFIKYHQITGYLEQLEKRLRYQLSVELNNPEGILQALGMTMLYNKRFNDAYNIYNKLIDDYDVKDSRTLFLAGVSAIASKHYANAIALFELARLKNRRNLETRYALGLLYLEAKNYEASSIQFKQFSEQKFISDFFNFNIKGSHR